MTSEYQYLEDRKNDLTVIQFNTNRDIEGVKDWLRFNDCLLNKLFPFSRNLIRQKIEHLKRLNIELRSCENEIALVIAEQIKCGTIALGMTQPIQRYEMENVRLNDRKYYTPPYSTSNWVSIPIHFRSSEIDRLLPTEIKLKDLDIKKHI